jgi:hypothetical protein
LTRARFAAVLLAANLACEAVPDLHFESADTGVDAGDASRGPDSGRQKDAAGEPDTQSASGCPGNPPDGAACCGDTPCMGDCNEAGCEVCISMCSGQTAKTLCCAKNAASHMCRSLSAGCP